MSIKRIMKEQKNPDGLEGHLERLEFDEQNRRTPSKFSFCSKSHKRSEWEILEVERLREEKISEKAKEKFESDQRLKQKCEYFKVGCTQRNCPRCRKNPNRKIWTLKRRERDLQKLEVTKNV